MRKLLEYLHLKDVGGLELVIALFPILIGYTIAGLPFGIALCGFLMIFVALNKKGKIFKKGPILIWFTFFVIHDILLLIVLDNAQRVFVNLMISCVAYVLTAVAVGNVIDYKKFRGCVNWVALLCMAGMLYHFTLAIRGMSFSPLTLPFFPAQDVSSRAFEEVVRPTSFFWEPQTYASFMLVPLFFALEERKYIWAAFTAITIFMSSSTTGLVAVFILFALTVLMGGASSGKHKVLNSVLVIVMALFLGFFLFRSGFFSQGLEKMYYESENMSEQVRLVQGPIVVSTMNLTDWFLGAPYANAYQYCVDRGITNMVVLYGENSMFVPTFWNALLRYGIIGLIIYLSIYWYYYKRNKQIRPYIICLLLFLFTNPDFMGGMFCFSMIFIISHNRYFVLHNEEKIYHKT